MSTPIASYRSLLEGERYEEALEAILSSSSPSVELKALQGRALSGLGRFQEAQALFKEALASDPGCHEAEAGLGIIAWLSGQPVLALKHLEAAVGLAPEIARYRGQRAMVHLQLKNGGAALEDFNRAERLGNTDPALMLAKAQLLLAKNRPQEARSALDMARSLGAEAASLDTLEGALARISGDLPLALSFYEKALAYDPSRISLWWETLGIASTLDKVKFVKLLKEARLHHPQDERILILTAARLREEGEQEKATALLEDGLKLSPNSPALLEFLGSYLREQDRNEEALSCFKQALELAPNSAKAHFGFGLACPDRDQALASFKRASDLEPENVVFLYHYGAVLSALGRYLEAIPVLTKAVEVDPSFWRALHERSICYQNLGKFASAEQDDKRYQELRAAAVGQKPGPLSPEANGSRFKNDGLELL